MSPVTFSYAVWLFFRILFIALIIVFLISGIDDLFIDLVHYVRLGFRALFRRKFISPVTREQLASIPEKPIALMIPAWDESNIIQRMLLNTAGVLDYKNVVIFVGTYPNDEATALEAAKAREVFPGIEIIVTPADGPTNKADCLNWIYQGILIFEKEHDIRFEAFIMQDAEDIIHPLWLKFVNYLMPRVDFIQLPVFPLETPWYNLVSGVCKDEFAENHTKDMRAREILADSLPSAGVGTALSRRTIAWMAKERNNQIFDIKSLTEDYLLGILLNRMPGRKIFLQQWVEYKQHRTNAVTGKVKEVLVKQPVATREFFPDSFRATVRQKSRWILGISLQGWSAGWTRSLGTNYCLYRDRKAIFTNLVVVAGYCVVLYWAAIVAYNRLTLNTEIPPLIETSEPYFKLGIVVMILFIWRVLNRMGSTWRIYGPLEGFMALPRLFVGNVVNFCATVMALQRFISSKISGKVPDWGKTEHAWPSEEQLRNYHRKLGDLLIERRMVTGVQIEEALEIQRRKGGKLGEILVDMGALWEEDLIHTLAVQSHRQSIEIDPYARPDLLDMVPRELAEKHRIFPVDMHGETLVLAYQSTSEGPAEAQVAAWLGRPVSFRPTTGADIDFAILRGYAGPASGMPLQDRLGPRLLREGLISPEELKEALRRQKRSNQRLGDIIIEMDLLTREQIEHPLREIES